MISSGTAQNGHEEQYCNFVVYRERAIRFHFFYSDKKGIDYLIKRVKAASQMKSEHSEKDDYLIDGKAFGKTKVGIGVIALAILAFMEFIIIKEIGFHAMTISNIVFALALCWVIFVDQIFYQVKIYRDKFYCRTNPFNGKWYKYSEITSCREIKKVVRYRRYRRGVRQRRYFFFFEFTDISGKTRKFQFAKEIHEHEVNVLKERIEQAQG